MATKKTENPYKDYKYKIEEILCTNYNPQQRSKVVERIVKIKNIVSRRRLNMLRRLKLSAAEETRPTVLDAIAVELGYTCANDIRNDINQAA